MDDADTSLLHKHSYILISKSGPVTDRYKFWQAEQMKYMELDEFKDISIAQKWQYKRRGEFDFLNFLTNLKQLCTTNNRYRACNKDNKIKLQGLRDCNTNKKINQGTSINNKIYSGLILTLYLSLLFKSRYLKIPP